MDLELELRPGNRILVVNLWANIELGVKLEGKAHPQTCDV